MKIPLLIIISTIYIGLTTHDSIADQPPSWNVLTASKDVQLLPELPKEFRGPYVLLQLAMNDREWKDVSAAKMNYMTLDANSAIEHLGGAKRTIQKVAVKGDDSGNPYVIMLLSDNTTMTIDLWSPSNRMALVTADSREASGIVNTIKMRCSINED